HRGGGALHLRHVILVAAELLSDDVHARDEALEDEGLRIHREVEAFARLARDGVLVADDQRARHRGVVEIVGRTHRALTLRRGPDAVNSCPTDRAAGARRRTW